MASVQVTRLLVRLPIALANHVVFAKQREHVGICDVVGQYAGANELPSVRVHLGEQPIGRKTAVAF
ncbi:hypothetical protein GALL_449910 [mine drainage metagenome]|uniref:Uncharacterized protein n=1 Tax=mine drainage metagenome TaxID=410659 RepID=A0A1J5Q0J5_9ZZZZ